MSRIVENTWECSSCQAKNRGRDMHCASCGSPKEANEAYVVPAPSSAPTVTDSELLRFSAAAPHWKCEFCGSQEHALNGACKNCAAPQEASEEMPSARTKTVHSSPSQVPLRSFPAPQYDELQYESPGVMPWFMLGGIGTLCVALVAFLLWIFLPHDVSVTVESATWEYTQQVQERVEKHDADWERNLPASAHNQSCQRRQDGTENCRPYDCNPHEVDHRCNAHDCNCHEVCHDLGNGFSKCDDVCSTCYDNCPTTEYDTCYEQCPVYRQWCSYDYYEWPTINSKKTSGHGKKVHWPGLQAQGSLQRLVQQEVYRVQFSNGEQIWDYVPPSFQDFIRFEEHASWKVQVNHAGQVWPLMSTE